MILSHSTDLSLHPPFVNTSEDLFVLFVAKHADAVIRGALFLRLSFL